MTETVRALVVDDEDGPRLFVEETLRRAGHAVTTAASGEEALDLLRDAAYDLIVLDLRLGGRVDGMRVLEAVRWRWPETVVVILTAHGSLESAVAAIREGVDGYLLKPVEPAELRRAVQEAMERRAGLIRLQRETRQARILRGGPFAVDVDKREATMDGRPLDLTPREFTLLCYLLEHADRAVGHKELVQAVREYEPRDIYEAQEIIKWYVHRLRQKVEPDPGHPRHIVTVRGVGYRFEG
jgi:DNA-binding response OmpR family regulator